MTQNSQSVLFVEVSAPIVHRQQDFFPLLSKEEEKIFDKCLFHLNEPCITPGVVCVWCTFFLSCAL